MNWIVELYLKNGEVKSEEVFAFSNERARTKVFQNNNLTWNEVKQANMIPIN